jgi:hypothetical protein
MLETMARRTIYLPKDIEALALANARDGESFSATVARLIEAAALAGEAGGERKYPDYVGSGEGPDDLGLNSEKYLKEIFEEFSD